MEGTVGVEGNSGVGMGVADTGGNEMDMTTDSEEDSKLHTSVSLTGTPCSCPWSDSASVWASGGTEVCLVILERPLWRTGSVAGVEATTDG